MTLSELKEDFYKRYLPSSNYLHYTANGMLCPLLGYPETEDAPSVSCALSMGVRMFARALGGEVVKVQNNASDKYLIYNFSDNIAPRRQPAKPHPKATRQRVHLKFFFSFCSPQYLSFCPRTKKCANRSRRNNESIMPYMTFC